MRGWTAPLGGSGSAPVSVASKFAPLIVFIGESNAVGCANNALATPTELSARPGVQILNNNTLLFETLDIGTNQQTDPLGLASALADHGWELGLANSVAAAEWRFDTVYLVKAAYGGQTVAALQGAPYFAQLVARVNAAKAQLAAAGKTPMVYLWCSVGINDAIAGTAAATLKTNLGAWHDAIRDLVGFAPILMTELPPTYAAYTTHLSDFAQTRAATYMVTAADLSLQNAAHWDYAGMKGIASRMVDKCLHTIGQEEAYLLSMLSALAQAGVSLGAGGGGSGPLTYTGAFTPVTWGNLQNTTASDSDLTLTVAAAPSGGTATVALDNANPWQVEVDLASAAAASAVVFYLDDLPYASRGYAWALPTFLTGAYVGSGESNLYWVGGGFSGSPGASGSPFALTFPAKVRLTKSGNDVIVSASNDGGSTFTTVGTDTGRLAGKATSYMKIAFSASNVTGRHAAMAYRTTTTGGS